jgi:hypothetical protein
VDPANRFDPSGREDFSLASFATASGISQVVQRLGVLSLQGAIFGAFFGATDASLAGKSGDEILDEAIQGGLMGAVLGPLARIRFVAPVLVAFGTATGISGRKLR